MERHTLAHLDSPATAEHVRRRLVELADPERAEAVQRYFKTGPGEYGEGDRFLGIPMPVLRKLAREARHLPLAGTLELLCSPVHEERMLALLLLVNAYAKGDAARREEVFRAYLAHTRHINNWDLVDASAEHIVGRHLRGSDFALLDELARSDSLWERRIAVLATFHFIKEREFAPALRIAERLLDDPHELIHKAVGWMLREIGQRDREAEEAFLRRHHRSMPRTMLRCAIERFPEPLRKRYLKGEL